MDATVAYKPQYLTSSFEGTVDEFFMATLGTKYGEPDLQDALAVPLRMEKLLARNMKELSGGELQKVAIVATMAQEAEVYALDEPSAFLDVEDRFVVARAINRMVKARGEGRDGHRPRPAGGRHRLRQADGLRRRAGRERGGDASR